MGYLSSIDQSCLCGSFAFTSHFTPMVWSSTNGVHWFLTTNYLINWLHKLELGQEIRARCTSRLISISYKCWVSWYSWNSVCKYNCTSTACRNWSATSLVSLSSLSSMIAVPWPYGLVFDSWIKGNCRLEFGINLSKLLLHISHTKHFCVISAVPSNSVIHINCMNLITSFCNIDIIFVTLILS